MPEVVVGINEEELAEQTIKEYQNSVTIDLKEHAEINEKNLIMNNKFVRLAVNIIQYMILFSLRFFLTLIVLSVIECINVFLHPGDQLHMIETDSGLLEKGLKFQQHFRFWALHNKYLELAKREILFTKYGNCYRIGVKLLVLAVLIVLIMVIASILKNIFLCIKIKELNLENQLLKEMIQQENYND